MALASVADTHSPVMGFLGSLHPSAVHFPIALLTVAALLELVHMLQRRNGLASTTLPLVFVAAVVAVPASVFGWLLATYEDTEGTTRDLHQWLGIASTVVAMATVVAALNAGTSTAALRVCRALLFAGAALVLVTGYFGGEMVFGEGHLFKYFHPDTTSDREPGRGDSSVAAPHAEAGTVDFATGIAPIIRTSCLKCHSAVRIKGKLRLDVKDRAMQGGKDGVVIVPGDGAKSRLYTRLIAPDEHDRMPQKADPLPTEQIDLVKKWIDEGAHWPDGFTISK